MKHFRWEEEVLKIIKKVGEEVGFELNSQQASLLAAAIVSWIDEHFGLKEDPIIRLNF